jgi:hypothetical protein
MREIVGDLWDHYREANSYILIPVNMDRKRNGRAVMGRGVAAQAKHRIPGIDSELGRFLGLLINGSPLGTVQIAPGVATFVTKRHWYEKSTLILIETSARRLATTARFNLFRTFYLPRPGCGNGGLRWEDVRAVIAPILPDNVVIVSKGAR